MVQYFLSLPIIYFCRERGGHDFGAAQIGIQQDGQSIYLSKNFIALYFLSVHRLLKLNEGVRTQFSNKSHAQYARCSGFISQHTYTQKVNERDLIWLSRFYYILDFYLRNRSRNHLQLLNLVTLRSLSCFCLVNRKVKLDNLICSVGNDTM